MEFETQEQLDTARPFLSQSKRKVTPELSTSQKMKKSVRASQKQSQVFERKLTCWEYMRDRSFRWWLKDFKAWITNPETFFISHSSSFKENWDFLIMITACWNVFMLPISIAFETKDDTVDIINAIVDICFVLDIIFCFRTTLLDDDSGEEIKDWRIIGSLYLRSRFTIDFLSTIPFDVVASLFLEEASAK